MREILFRGKRLDNGEWIQGDLVQFPAHGVVIIVKQEPPYGDAEVDSDTVGQFIGLTDKNGKRIFEGDICRMKVDRLKGYGAITFMDAAFVLCDKTHKQTRYYPLYPDGQFTVVGNIHDNLELSEVTE